MSLQDQAIFAAVIAFAVILALFLAHNRLAHELRNEM
jgi:hypothetical protein